MTIPQDGFGELNAPSRQRSSTDKAPSRDGHQLLCVVQVKRLPAQTRLCSQMCSEEMFISCSRVPLTSGSSGSLWSDAAPACSDKVVQPVALQGDLHLL